MIHGSKTIPWLCVLVTITQAYGAVHDWQEGKLHITFPSTCHLRADQILEVTTN